MRWLIALMLTSPLMADETVSTIEKLGGTVRLVSAKSDALEVDFQHSEVRDQDLKLLSNLKNVTVLRLKKTAITDAGLIHVGKLESLKRLHLEQTAITDEGLKYLIGLKNLEYLNLFGTKVGKGIQALKSLLNLRRLFVAQTKVSEAEILRLKKSNRDLKIVPDPESESRRIVNIHRISKEALARAEQALKLAEKDAKELPPKAAQLKREFEQARKRASDLKKQADRARRDYDQARKKARNKNASQDVKQRAEKLRIAYEQLDRQRKEAKQLEAQARIVKCPQSFRGIEACSGKRPRTGFKV